MSELLAATIPLATLIAVALLFCILIVWFVMNQIHMKFMQDENRQKLQEQQQVLQGKEQQLQEKVELLEQQQKQVAKANAEQELLAQQEKQIEQSQKEIKENQQKIIVANTDLEKYKTDQNHYKQKIEEQNEQLTLLESKREDLAQANKTIETMKVKQEEQEKRFDEKQEFLQKQEKEMQERFENLANQILENKGKQFSEQQNEKLNELLKPFKTDLANFKAESETARKNEIEKRGQLDEKFAQLVTLNQQLSQDATNLTKALKGESQKQGAWGEIILEKVLESSGLRKGHEYTVQDSLKDEEGKNKRPDALVYLPDGKVIIIDAKTSLTAYSEFSDADDEATRHEYLNAHVKSVESHIKSLADKGYPDIPELKNKTLDMTLMFIPIEGAFSAALQTKSSLCDDAFKKRIFIASPTTLFVVLHTVKKLWSVEEQTQNVREIAEHASKMLDKFNSFVEDLEKVGTQFDKAKMTYDDAWKKLISGKGNLISQAEKMQNLGITSKKKINPKILEHAYTEE